MKFKNFKDNAMNFKDFKENALKFKDNSRVRPGTSLVKFKGFSRFQGCVGTLQLGTIKRRELMWYGHTSFQEKHILGRPRKIHVWLDNTCIWEWTKTPV